MATSEHEIWQWASSGTLDERPDRRRTYYKQVSVRHRHINEKRYFKVGDAVVMSGNDGHVWIAQIVNLFQAHQDDIHIKDMLPNFTPCSDDEGRQDLMRCTLRWFYNISDMNHHTLNTSRISSPMHDEIWFSDHVEQDGFNEVQAIEGKAWLFPNTQAKQAFIKDPDPSLDTLTDKLRVVRCFVNSKTVHLPIRELERTELERLLRNPTTDKNLFERSRLRFYGSVGEALKSIGNKKRPLISLRSPSSVTEDNAEPSPLTKNSRVHVAEAGFEVDFKGCPDAGTETTDTLSKRFRKVDNKDTKEDTNACSNHSMSPGIYRDDDEERLANRIQELDRQQQAYARRIQKENEDVLAWVTELNNIALNGDLDENSNSSETLVQ